MSKYAARSTKMKTEKQPQTEYNKYKIYVALPKIVSKLIYKTLFF